MLSLSNLKPAPGAIKKRKRVGRGYGSGTGKTAGRGMNGQKSRSGFHRRNLAFEGGQMPLVRRIPKRGFTNIFKKEYSIVNLEAIDKTGLKEITVNDFFEKKLVRNRRAGIKVLGEGKLRRGVTIQAHRFSRSAVEKIEKAGGKAILCKGDEP